MSSTRRKSVRYGLWSLVLLALLIACAAVWLLATTAGATWLIARASTMLPQPLVVRSLEGTLAGELTGNGLRYGDPNAALSVNAQTVRLDIALSQLLLGTLHIEAAYARGLDIVLRESDQQFPSQRTRAGSFDLKPPIDIVLDRLQIEQGEVRSDQKAVLEIDTLSLAGAWTERRISIAEFALNARQGSAQLEGSLQLGDLYAAQADGQFHWLLAGESVEGKLAVDSQGQTIRARVELSQPTEATLALSLSQQNPTSWTLKLDVGRFNPNIGPLASLDTVAASLEGHGTAARAMLSGRISVNGAALTLQSIDIGLANERATMSANATLAASHGDIHLTGALDLSEQQWHANAQLEWHDTTLPAAWTGQTLQTQGSLHVLANDQRLQVDGDLQLGPPERLAQIEIKDVSMNFGGAHKRIQIGMLVVDQPKGDLSMHGQVQLNPFLRWKVAASATTFNPGAFFPRWPGEVSFRLQTQGAWRDARPTGELHLTKLQGKLRGQPISGGGDLAFGKDSVLSGELTLRSAQSIVELRAARQDTWDAAIDLNIASLSHWVPGASGRVRGRVALEGSWPTLELDGKLKARHVEIASVRTDRASLEAHLSDVSRPRGSLQLEFSGLSTQSIDARSGRLQIDGDAEQHTLIAQLDGESLSGTLRVQGTRDQHSGAERWTETIQQLRLELPRMPALTLVDPTSVVLHDARLRVRPLCLRASGRRNDATKVGARDEDAKICLQGHVDRTGTLAARYSLQELPLAVVQAVLPATPVDLVGSLAGDGTIERNANGELFGQAELLSPAGRLTLAGEPTAERPLLTYRDLHVRVRATGDTAQLRAGAQLNDAGVFSGTLRVMKLGSTRRPISGSMRLRLADVSALTLATAQIANVQGRARIQAAIGGVLSEPRIAVRIHAENLAADIPALGLHLQHGKLEITPRSGREHTLSGSVGSGDGQISFEGIASRSGEVSVDVTGERFLAADLAGARVVIDPDLHFSRTPQLARLTGTVRIPHANVNLQRLPQAVRAQRSSPDVVIVDAKLARDEAQKLPLFANLELVLGEDVTLHGFGLQGEITGQLQVREAPGEPTTGSGELRISGSYQAYGQDLTITQGNVMFANTPIDNPSLRIVAERNLEDVTAGLRITGTAQQPELNVFADPAMDDASALSYLVAGRPLENLSPDSAEVDALESATRSLGTAAGGLLAKRIGERLGLDTFAIEESEVLETSALTIGTYLSPRLYLSYGFGLFEPGDIVKLRYRISDELALRAIRGPEETRAALEYRIER